MNIKVIFQIFRLLFVLPGIKWSDDYFIKDLKRYKNILNMKTSNFISLAIILWEKPEFRNLFVYRNRNRKIYPYWFKFIYRPVSTLYIESKQIGGGLFIQHGFSTIIAAESIGENCWINQQVTIGYSGNTRPPIIGNNVMITCGAKVLGDIKIDDNVIIGANAVVVKNVEKGVTVGGVPARKIK